MIWIVTNLRTGDTGIKFPALVGIHLLTRTSLTGSGFRQFPVQWVSKVLSSAVKRPGREVNHSPPSSAEVKSRWSCTSYPFILLHGVHRGNLVCTTFQDFLVSASVVALYHGTGRGLIINLIVAQCIFCRITSVYQPTNAHIISHKTLSKHFKTPRHVSILSDHHQGALFLAKVILQYSQFNSYLQTR